MKPTEVENLFATPVIRYTVPDYAMLNMNLISLGHKMRNESDGVTKTNRRGWHSEGNLLEVKNPAVKQLTQHFGNAVISATKEIGAQPKSGRIDFSLFAWMNINPPGGYNTPHTHPGAHWSGCYYVSQPKVEEGSSGMIEFLDPRSDLANYYTLNAPPFRHKRTFRPKVGEIVMFPSYLVHWVYPNETDEERISIAFNATFSF